MKNNIIRQMLVLKRRTSLVANAILKLINKTIGVYFIHNRNSNKNRSNEAAFLHCKRTGMSYDRLQAIAYAQVRVWLPNLTEKQRKGLGQ